VATEESTKREHGMKRTWKDAIAERRIRRKESRRGQKRRKVFRKNENNRRNEAKNDRKAESGRQKDTKEAEEEKR
jgi:hypothetical protein